MNAFEIGALVRSARRGLDWTQLDLARKAEVGVQTVVRIEAGHGGVAHDNLSLVLAAVGLSMDVKSLQAAAGAALHPLNVDSERVEEVVRAAVTAACTELDALFPGAKPEVNGICSNFAGLLEYHIKALLHGEQHAQRSHWTHLPKLVWASRDFGRPFSLPDGALGYLVEVVGEDRFLEPANDYSNITSPFRPGRYCTDLFSSWTAAVEAALKCIEQDGNPEGMLRIVPGTFVGDEQGVGIFYEVAAGAEAGVDGSTED